MKIRHSFARNLSLKILLASSGLLFLVLLGVTISDFVTTTRSCVRNIDSQMQLFVKKIEAEFNNVSSIADNTSLLIDNFPVSRKAYNEVLTKVADANPHIFGISVVLGIDNTFVADMMFPSVEKDLKTGHIVPVRQDYVLSKEEYAEIYNNVRQIAETVHWYGPYYSPKQKIYELSYLVAAGKGQGNDTPIVEAVMTIDWLTDLLNKIEPCKGTMACIIDKDNRIISSSTDFTLGEEDLSEVQDSTGHVGILQPSSRLGYLNNISDSQFTGSIDNLKFQMDTQRGLMICTAPLVQGWTLMIGCPFDEVFADVISQLWNMAIGLLICILLLFFFCRRIIYKKVQPLSQFSEATQNIAQGNFDSKLPPIKGNDEIAALHHSFENMQSSLRQYIEDLRETTIKKEKMESELNIASEIQLQVLRKEFPDTDKFSLYAQMHPAREVGGDLYDFVQKGDKLYFCIGDVSGKGVPAALLMTTATMIFRHICSTSDLPMNQVMSLINTRLADGNDMGFFVTFIVACLDTSAGHLRFCNAGHNRMIVMEPDGQARFINAKPNLVCGVFDQFDYQEEALDLKHGSRVLFYTDGINEAMNPSGEQFGDERLIRWAGNAAGIADEKALVESIVSCTREFAMGAEQSDDITALSVRLK